MNDFTRENPAEKESEDTSKVMHYPLYNLIVMFFIFSCVGWIWEVIYIAFTEGVVAKRGMLHGPWLPIYGVGGILILLLFGRYQSRPILVFILTVILCTVMEYSTALAVEAIFKCRWWDYSTKFMNFNGRVCLGGMLLFGLSGMTAVCKAGPILNDKIGHLRPRLHNFIIISLSVAFVADFIFSMIFPNVGVGVTYALLH